MNDTFRRKFHSPFHDLWGQVVGHTKYNKRDWQALDALLWSAWESKDELRAATVLTLASQLRDAQLDDNQSLGE
jgi:hypothetical protein